MTTRVVASGGGSGGEEPPPEAYDRIGPYRLVQQLGEGGMGVVHLAVDPGGRAVAIKVLRDHVAHDVDARARLAREVATLARVQDPRVAAVLDADTVGSRPYIVTRYVPGPPLDHVVGEQGPLDADGLLRLGRGLSGALTEIHAAGVIHRDLKPANVLLLDGDPVVIDFGIAHVADDIRLTMTGLVMGTPGYLSPEIVEGAPVTEATDWWGFAATLAFAAKGAPPFGRGPMDVVLDRVRRGQADLSGVDERLLPLLYAALSPDAAGRPHATEVVAALDRYAAGGEAFVTAGTGALPAVPPTMPIGPPQTAQWPDVAPGEEALASWPPPQGAAPLPAPPVGYATAPDPAAYRSSPDPAAYESSTDPAAYRSSTDPAWASAGTVAEPYDDLLGGFAPGADGASAPAHPDPRIGLPRRTWTLLSALVAVTALAAVWPVVAGAVVVVLVWAARLTDRSMTSLVMRRYENGRRRSDVPVAVLLGPMHLLSSAVSTVLTLLVPLFVAAAAVVAAGLGLAALTGSPPRLDRSLPLAAGMLVGLVMLWWGPGGVSLRRGARSIVRTVSPGPLAQQVAVVTLLLLGAGLGLWAWLRHGLPDWAPYTADQVASVFRLPGL